MTDNDPSAQDKPAAGPGSPGHSDPTEHGGAATPGDPVEREGTGPVHGGEQQPPPHPPYAPAGHYPPTSGYGQAYGASSQPTAPTAQSYPYYGAYPPNHETGRRGTTARKLFVGFALLAVLLGGGAGAAGGYLVAEMTTASGSSSALDQAPPAERTGTAPAGSIEAVAQKLAPSVVQLQVQGMNSASEGSGFVISEDGYILTNNHVVAGAAQGGQIIVVFNDGKEVQAEIVGRDPTTDIAVVRAQDVSGLATVELGRSDDLRVGQSVVAIGSPYELAGTVTAGIVSSLNRPVTAGGQGDQTTVMDAIQTDAAINPGNSGGPLANMAGQVIGINSAIYSPSQGGNVGIGFAIPIDQARRTADQIIENGYATQTYIGATVGNAPGDGAMIGEVQAGSPAEKAGLGSGDVIVKMDDRLIEDANTLVAAIRTRAPGEKVTFTLSNGETVEATLGGQPVRVN